ncbi:MAG: molybdopterin converting factor subunit 1 [Bacteroidetes bacterium]|jgi:molybdopterin synthase sulfur carrier subunit|nr:molybdopterin converting factor subunit 1 [Bacteroidota bacterium]
MSTSSITIEVLLFSVLRERVGAGHVEVTVPAPTTARGVLEAVVEAYPSVADYERVVRIAVNQEYVTDEAPVQAGDEVALITPVSGG